MAGVVVGEIGPKMGMNSNNQVEDIIVNITINIIIIIIDMENSSCDELKRAKKSQKEVKRAKKS